MECATLSGKRPKQTKSTGYLITQSHPSSVFDLPVRMHDHAFALGRAFLQLGEQCAAVTDFDGAQASIGRINALFVQV